MHIAVTLGMIEEATTKKIKEGALRTTRAHGDVNARHSPNWTKLANRKRWRHGKTGGKVPTIARSTLGNSLVREQGDLTDARTLSRYRDTREKLNY